MGTASGGARSLDGAANARVTACAPRGAARRDPEGAGKDPTKDPIDATDPAFRQTAHLAVAPVTGAAPSSEPVPTRARVSIEDLLPQLVRRIAWAGDRRKGTMQLELGAGTYDGTTVTVHADSGRVRLELTGPGADELRERVTARLHARGLDVEAT